MCWPPLPPLLSSLRQSAPTRRRPSARSRRSSAPPRASRRTRRASQGRCRGRAIRSGEILDREDAGFRLGLERRSADHVVGSSASKSSGFSTRSCSAILPPMRTVSARPPRCWSTPSLSSTFAPPETRTNGQLDLAEQRAEVAQLLLEQQAGVGRKQMRDRLGRRVRTMRGAEGVVHVQVAAVRELAAGVLVVLRLPRVEARVSRARGCDRPEHPRAAARRRAPSGTPRRRPSGGRGASTPGCRTRRARAAAEASATTRGYACRRRPCRSRAERSDPPGPERPCRRRRRHEPSAECASTRRRRPASSGRSSRPDRRGGSCSPTRCRTSRRP